MDLELKRMWLTETWTLGQLLINGVSECMILEDRVRHGPKVYGQTAIPAGRYRVVIAPSKRYGRPMPRLLDVPGFTGILIHPGNSAADTHGCLLTGRTANLLTGTFPAGESGPAFVLVVETIKTALNAREEVWITIHEDEVLSDTRTGEL